MSVSFNSAYADYKDLREQEEHNDKVYEESRQNFVNQIRNARRGDDTKAIFVDCPICKKSTFVLMYDTTDIRNWKFELGCSHIIAVEGVELK
jgi:hypothetical protein